MPGAGVPVREGEGRKRGRERRGEGQGDKRAGRGGGRQRMRKMGSFLSMGLPKDLIRRSTHESVVDLSVGPSVGMDPSWGLVPSGV